MRGSSPLLASLVAALALATACATSPADPGAGAAPERAASPLGPARQLTFDGLRSGEGYFSADGRQLVFQSEREPGNPFYQIYRMDLETGRVLRVSPGSGKTTCAYFHPSGTRLLFSSTHLDPRTASLQQQELARREQGVEQRYAWDYDPHYDVFSVALAPEKPGSQAASKPQRLTAAPGYDAEASWSPDGRQIVFASNRHVYESDGSPARALSAAERERLAADPAYFVELYAMDERGRNVRRLTNSPGYDGGPFFSPDGERIVFRRFSEDGARAEIFSMRKDGSDVRPLTRLGAMSWAPFYHPSGDYLIFATNLHGFENFELYAVDAGGSAAPVRVTSQDGFDGLPVFSPDGDEIVFTRKPPHGKSQLYRADWDDDLARQQLGLASRSFHAVGPMLPVPAPLSAEIEPDELRESVELLTSDATEGRLTGSTGERIATSWVARMFRALGLEPAGQDDTYFQEFGFTAGVSLGANNALRATLPAEPAPLELVQGRDWRPLGFSRIGEVPDSEVVFAGYGLVAPAADGRPAVDDYAHLDVEDRFVIALRFLPEGLDEAERQRLSRHSSLRYKAMQARDRGARGILFVSGPTSQVREQLAPLRFDASLSGTSIAVASLSDDAADRLIRAGSDQNLADLQAVLDRELALPGFALAGVRLGGSFDVQQQRKKGRNVIARLPATRPPAPGPDGAPAEPLPVVLVGAHVDHLGHGEAAGSLAKSGEETSAHRGADDNASGVAALLEIAGWLARERDAGRLATTRDILFAAWSGEELGLLGSAAWADLELARIGAGAVGSTGPADLSPRVAAVLNLDMVGRLRDELALFGADSSPIWPGEIEQQNAPIGLPIALLGDSYLPTDATTFYLARVPILSAFTGSHAEYHTPRDVAETLDYDGLAAIAKLFAGVTASLAARETAPAWVATAAPEHGLPRAGLRVYLGTIPDYTHANADGRPGLLLAGVAAGGPAERAGLRAGDVVVEVDGRAIENIYDYTYSLDALRVGVPVKVVFRRADSETAVMLTPASRE